MMMRSDGLRVLLAACCLYAAGAQARALGDNRVKLAPSPFSLPQNIGPLRYAGENHYSDRRMGRAFSFSASGISLKLYVYDYGQHGVPDGPDAIPTCEQFENAKREIERGGNYEDVSLRGEFSRPMGSGKDPPVAREAVYDLVRNGIHAVSVLWVTAANGYFLKLRLSLRTEVADELVEAREQVLGSMAAALAEHPAANPLTTPASPQESSIDVASTADTASASAWLAYAVELTRLAGEHPEILPPCGGPLTPGFAAELAGRQAALREYRSRAASLRTSSYFDQLDGIEAAGFLDEYAWHYLRNEHLDLTPPATLDLAAFEQFREAHLTTHVVQSGARVRINATRHLPAAPAG